MRLVILRATLALLLVAAAFSLQQPAPIPPFEGDGNPQHDGQPSYCQNFDTKFAHNCKCIDMQDQACDRTEQESAKCKVYCRKHACRCKTSCNTQ
jgi:hypothetical protein